MTVLMKDITYRRPIAWNSYALSDVGCVREVNEDAVIMSPDSSLWAIADGMGGHQVGDVASKKIIEVLEQVPFNESLSDYIDAVENALLLANRQLLDYATKMFGNKTMGSTAVCLVIKQHVGVCLWVGDSRLYRYRNYQLQQLTRDHSQVEEMVQMGLITSEEAEHHPHKNVITRAVGVEPQLYIDINVFSTQVGDTFLLCSDGLYNAVSKRDVEDMLGQRDAEHCVLALMKTALDNGADDNVSLIVIKGEPGKLS